MWATHRLERRKMKQETLNKVNDLEDQITRLKRLIDTLYKKNYLKVFSSFKTRQSLMKE